MTTKEKPEFNDEFSEAEFFGFAKSYLSEAFPNPQRVGCPPDSDLQHMAEQPAEARDAAASQHLLLAVLQPLHGSFSEPET